MRGQAVLSFDLAGTRDAVDRTLGLLQWMSGWLLSQELAHTVCWLDPESFEPQSAQIASAEDLRALLELLLHTGLKEGTPSIANRSFPAADWRYHIGQTRRRWQYDCGKAEPSCGACRGNLRVRRELRRGLLPRECVWSAG